MPFCMCFNVINFNYWDQINWFLINKGFTCIADMWRCHRVCQPIIIQNMFVIHCDICTIYIMAVKIKVLAFISWGELHRIFHCIKYDQMCLLNIISQLVITRSEALIRVPFVKQIIITILLALIANWLSAFFTQVPIFATRSIAVSAKITTVINGVIPEFAMFAE